MLIRFLGSILSPLVLGTVLDIEDSSPTWTLRDE